MWDAYSHTLEELSPTISEGLFHYCPMEKLQYLLAPGADLKCRNLTCLSDCKEYRYGVQLFCNYVKSKGNCYQRLAEVLRDKITSNIGREGDRLRRPVVPYVFSLTERPNSQHHVREYCKGNGGAIVFSQSRLSHMIDLRIKQGFSLRLLKCYYEKRNERDVGAMPKLFDAVWSDCIEDFERLMQTGFSDEEAGKRVSCEICSLAAQLKHNDFKPDDEWRIVFVSRDCEGAEDNDGFISTGIRSCTGSNDLIEVMHEVVVHAEGNNDAVSSELLRFALHQRNRELKVWPNGAFCESSNGKLR